jgi:hypothetical protein
MAKKKIKKVISLLKYKSPLEDPLEALDALKARIEGMPVHLLLIEYRNLSERLGYNEKAEQDFLSNATRDVYDRLHLVREHIMEKFHELNDTIAMLEYQVDEAYRTLRSKEQNVKVFKKSIKQSK